MPVIGHDDDDDESHESAARVAYFILTYSFRCDSSQSNSDFIRDKRLGTFINSHSEIAHESNNRINNNKW